MSKMTKTIWMVILVSAGSACTTAKDSGNARVIVEFDGKAWNKKASELLSLTAPEALSGFTCYVLNVVGSNIPTSEDGDLVTKKLTHLSEGGYCSYSGVTSPPIATGASTTVELS